MFIGLLFILLLCVEFLYYLIVIKKKKKYIYIYIYIVRNLAIFVKKVKIKKRKNWEKKNKIAVMNHESWHLGGKQDKN